MRGDPAVGPGVKVQTSVPSAHLIQHHELLFLLNRTSPGRLSRQQREHIVSHYLRHRNSMYVCVCVVQLKQKKPLMIRLGEKKGWELKIPLTSMSLWWAGVLLLLAGIASSVSSSALITDTGLSLKQWLYFRTFWHWNSLKSLWDEINVQCKYKKMMFSVIFVISIWQEMVYV